MGSEPPAQEDREHRSGEFETEDVNRGDGEPEPRLGPTHCFKAKFFARRGRQSEELGGQPVENELGENVLRMLSALVGWAEEESEGGKLCRGVR